MNTNQFKILLSICTMAIAGCNKIGNPSYMDGSGDRKDEKSEKQEEAHRSYQNPDEGAVGSVSISSTMEYNQVLQDSLSAIKRRVDIAEQVATSKQQAAERAIKDASHAKSTAESLRKTANEREKARLDLVRERHVREPEE